MASFDFNRVQEEVLVCNKKSWYVQLNIRAGLLKLLSYTAPFRDVRTYKDFVALHLKHLH